MTRIKNFKLIEGTVSDFRQSRVTITLDCSYECFFLLSGTPVALRVSSPIFIKNGEAVRVVGRYSLDGVFYAVAYCNQSSRVSGNSDWASVQGRFAAGMTVALGLMVFYAVFDRLFGREGLSLSDPLVISLVLFGLPLVIVGWIMFVRRRSELRAIGRLLTPWRRF